jgi:hypothetical protein
LNCAAIVYLCLSDEQVLVGSSPRLNDLLALVVQRPLTGINPLTEQTSMLNCFLTAGVGAGCSFLTTGLGVGEALALAN